jgi:hypothetical protein
MKDEKRLLSHLPFAKRYLLSWNILCCSVQDDEKGRVAMGKLWKLSMFLMGYAKLKTTRVETRRRIVFIVTLCLLLSFFVLPGCQRQETSPYKVVDSRIWISPQGSDEHTFWIDNERVVFISNKTMAPAVGPEFMTVWSPDTGKVEFPTELKGLICVQDGQVFFTKKDVSTGATKHYRGPIDNPQEHPSPYKRVWIDRYFDCDFSQGSSRSKLPYTIKLKNDNYLEITEERICCPVQSQGKARYYERADLPPVQLPVYADLASLGNSYEIRFNQLRNAYLISPSGYVPGDSYYQSMWWLSRDGHLTQVLLPKKTIWPAQGRIDVYPLRDSYLVQYTGGKWSVTNPGASGLYLIRGDQMEKILIGSIHGVSISPDGCRAAFAYARNAKEYLSRKKPHRTVRSINFCEGRREE